MKTMGMEVGVFSVGMFLPTEVRRNDWWPAATVERWKAERRPGPRPEGPLSPGAERVVRALSEQAFDPFGGAVERRIMPAGMKAVDMAELAAKDALARADVTPGQIDLLLTHTVVPDLLIANPACELHHRLGLSPRCFAMETDAAAYAFMMQLAIARGMILTGQARCALIVQTSASTHLSEREDPISPLFGDGATAVVVGRVSEGRGILGSVTFTDGKTPRTLAASVQGGAWYDEGKGKLLVADPAQMQRVFLQTADCCKTSVEAVLADSGFEKSQIDYFAMYQGTPWLRRVVQEYVGLERARCADTFGQTGYLFAALIPSSLYVAEQQGLVKPDDLVMITGGGTGMTFGSMLVRWGR